MMLFWSLLSIYIVGVPFAVFVYSYLEDNDYTDIGFGIIGFFAIVWPITAPCYSIFWLSILLGRVGEKFIR